MIFMRMGEDEADKIAALFHEITDVGQDEIDPGKVIPGESDAEIHREPLPMSFVPKSVKREVHANLAHAAERGEDKLIGRTKHGAAARLAQDDQIGSCDGLEMAARQAQQQVTRLIELLENP